MRSPRSPIGKRPQVASKAPFRARIRQQKILGQPRKLCPRHGVLPRPIVSDPRKEYLSIFSRAIFSTPWYFRERPIFGILGRFEGLCGLVRPHARACLSREFGGLRTCDVSQLQFTATAVLALEPCFGCTTAFFLRQPPHRRPMPAFCTKRQRLIGCRDAAHLGGVRRGKRLSLLR